MSIHDAIQAMKQGEFVIVVDDEDRENEGDFVLAAEDITSEKLNFLLEEAKGLICVPMEGSRLDQLDLPPMVKENEESTRCAFTVSVDAREGITTGISAVDRARAIKLLSDPDATASDFVRPGHIFPLRKAKGGLEERKGHTEASLELCRLAGKQPASVICEILAEDGTLARGPELGEIAKKHGTPLVSVQEICDHLLVTTK